jgi:hypothetical protein
MILHQKNRTALWLYAPGYLNSDAGDAPIHVDHMQDLTGFTFGRSENYWAPFMHITNFSHPITQTLPQDLFWGTTRSLGPTFFLKDPQAVNLGQVVLSSGRCKPGLGVKTFHHDQESWHSVYCATPNIPPALLRTIAGFAGVHLYNHDGDVLYASRDLLSVHTVSGGARTFRLPRPVEMVYDLYRDQVLARDTDRFEVQMNPASTALYFTGEAGLIHALTA